LRPQSSDSSLPAPNSGTSHCRKDGRRPVFQEADPEDTSYWRDAVGCARPTWPGAALYQSLGARKKLADIASILNSEDTHVVNYALKTLQALGPV
jgi:hypothetical protein